MIGRKFSTIAPRFGASWCEDGQDLNPFDPGARFGATCSREHLLALGDVFSRSRFLGLARGLPGAIRGKVCQEWSQTDEAYALRAFQQQLLDFRTAQTLDAVELKVVPIGQFQFPVSSEPIGLTGFASLQDDISADDFVQHANGSERWFTAAIGTSGHDGDSFSKSLAGRHAFHETKGFFLFERPKPIPNQDLTLFSDDLVHHNLPKRLAVVALLNGHLGVRIIGHGFNDSQFGSVAAVGFRIHAVILGNIERGGYQRPSHYLCESCAEIEVRWNRKGDANEKEPPERGSK